ncbi:hypothetical protein OIU74_003389 [Salix koriyanagi]|uniref:Uncharacterized protein n=1 Tax=Salix koriyanagi TaxID=2511006 RepID=A0A9Q0UYG6_9ROSI|nr:hypothetical protein OIU74_003389 [Salix koriyanagi]
MPAIKGICFSFSVTSFACLLGHQWQSLHGFLWSCNPVVERTKIFIFTCSFDMELFVSLISRVFPLFCAPQYGTSPSLHLCPLIRVMDRGVMMRGADPMKLSFTCKGKAWLMIVSITLDFESAVTLEHANVFTINKHV